MTPFTLVFNLFAFPLDLADYPLPSQGVRRIMIARLALARTVGDGLQRPTTAWEP
jgi:hypothetical protein